MINHFLYMQLETLEQWSRSQKEFESPVSEFQPSSELLMLAIRMTATLKASYCHHDQQKLQSQRSK